MLSKKLQIYVEDKTFVDEHLNVDDDYNELKDQFNVFKSNHDDIDLIVCLGGDGTLLYANSLFPRKSPPG